MYYYKIPQGIVVCFCIGICTHFNGKYDVAYKVIARFYVMDCFTSFAMTKW
ncbi:hypothetical protein [Helicobacter rodentium]|uniref:hypothetical protein n=1 Tax=Helicobacter rodentium TaxID=59617 RepID=UPI0023F35164|nr:hypothetical protein [Helicobacter rodentium]